MHKSAAYTSFTIDALIGRRVVGSPPSALSLLQNISCALPSLGFGQVPCIDAPRFFSSAPNTAATHLLLDTCCPPSSSPPSPVNRFFCSLSPSRHSACKDEEDEEDEDDIWRRRRQKRIEGGLEESEERREEGERGGGSDLHAFHVYDPLVRSSRLNHQRQCEEEEDLIHGASEVANSSLSEEDRKISRSLDFGGDYDRPLFPFAVPPLPHPPAPHLPSVAAAAAAAADRMMLSADSRMWSSRLDGQETRYVRRKSSSRYPVVNDPSPSAIRSGSGVTNNCLRRRNSTDGQYTNALHSPPPWTLTRPPPFFLPHHPTTHVI